MASSFNSSTLFEFEKDFDEDSFFKWINANWTLSLWFASLYVAIVFGGRRYMEKRPRFEIRGLLALWSGVLAIFSIFGSGRTIPELVYVIKNYGLECSICIPYYYGPNAFWGYMFTMSKVYELGDTMFIVLRKQPLIFLHWYHHVTVLIYVWYSYTDHTAPAGWFMVMNYTVHSFMYSYYFLRAMRITVPKFVNMFITVIQTLQMVAGVGITIMAYKVKNRGDYCQISLENMRYGFIMYFTYFLLFAYFFYNAYLGSKNNKKGSRPVENTADVLQKKVQ